MSTDPTAIPIELDPRESRISGVAIHGDTPFDMPVISEIGHNLWMGGCVTGLVLPSFVKHVVSLYPWEQYTVGHELESQLAVRAYDSTEAVDGDRVRSLAVWVNECRRTGPVLVHCQAGLNRSGLVTAAALILEGAAPEQAIAWVRRNRSQACLCNPVFEAWLRDGLA